MKKIYNLDQLVSVHVDGAFDNATYFIEYQPARKTWYGKYISMRWYDRLNNKSYSYDQLAEEFPNHKINSVNKLVQKPHLYYKFSNGDTFTRYFDSEVSRDINLNDLRIKFPNIMIV